MSAPLTAPYTDAAATKAYYQSLYDGLVTASDPMAGLALFSRAYGFSSVEELMASPCRINSGSVTATANWFATFTFVPLKMARTTVDEVGISDGGYKLFFWCRTTAKCEGVANLPDGSKLDLTGKEFKDRRWAVVMTFDRATKKATMMEVLWDYAEVGRMMGCPSYALACATQELYPA